MTNQPTPDDLARDLDQDLAICDKATAGPWYAVPCGTKDCWCKAITTVPGSDYIGDAVVCAGCLKANDADFAAAARTGWPAALRRLKAAEAELKQLRREYAEYRREHHPAEEIS